MKKHLNLFLAFAFLAFVFVINAASQTTSQAANQQLALWKTFSPAGNNFKASLPAAPRELEDNEKDQVVTSIKNQVKKSEGNMAVFDNVSVYTLDTQWNGFGIVVFNYKWQKIDYDEKSGNLVLSSEKLLDETVLLHEWWEFEKAKRVSSEVFIVERDFTRDGRKSKARAVVTKNKVYILTVAMPDLYSAPPALAGVYQAEADKFFNSFQILDNKPQIARGAVKSLKVTN
jgi:hypothetical protein